MDGPDTASSGTDDLGDNDIEAPSAEQAASERNEHDAMANAATSAVPESVTTKLEERKQICYDIILQANLGVDGTIAFVSTIKNATSLSIIKDVLCAALQRWDGPAQGSRPRPFCNWTACPDMLFGDVFMHPVVKAVMHSKGQDYTRRATSTLRVLFCKELLDLGKRYHHIWYTMPRSAETVLVKYGLSNQLAIHKAFYSNLFKAADAVSAIHKARSSSGHVAIPDDVRESILKAVHLDITDKDGADDFLDLAYVLWRLYPRANWQRVEHFMNTHTLVKVKKAKRRAAAAPSRKRKNDDDDDDDSEPEQYAPRGQEKRKKGMRKEEEDAQVRMQEYLKDANYTRVFDDAINFWDKDGYHQLYNYWNVKLLEKTEGTPETDKLFMMLIGQPHAWMITSLRKQQERLDEDLQSDGDTVVDVQRARLEVALAKHPFYSRQPSLRRHIMSLPSSKLTPLFAQHEQALQRVQPVEMLQGVGTPARPTIDLIGVHEPIVFAAWKAYLTFAMKLVPKRARGGYEFCGVGMFMSLLRYHWHRQTSAYKADLPIPVYNALYQDAPRYMLLRHSEDLFAKQTPDGVLPRASLRLWKGYYLKEALKACEAKLEHGAATQAGVYEIQQGQRQREIFNRIEESVMASFAPQLKRRAHPLGLFHWHEYWPLTDWIRPAGYTPPTDFQARSLYDALTMFRPLLTPAEQARLKQHQSNSWLELTTDKKPGMKGGTASISQELDALALTALATWKDTFERENDKDFKQGGGTKAKKLLAEYYRDLLQAFLEKCPPPSATGSASPPEPTLPFSNWAYVPNTIWYDSYLADLRADQSQQKKEQAAAPVVRVTARSVGGKSLGKRPPAVGTAATTDILHKVKVPRVVAPSVVVASGAPGGDIVYRVAPPSRAEDTDEDAEKESGESSDESDHAGESGESSEESEVADDDNAAESGDESSDESEVSDGDHAAVSGDESSGGEGSDATMFSDEDGMPRQGAARASANGVESDESDDAHEAPPGPNADHGVIESDESDDSDGSETEDEG